MKKNLLIDFIKRNAAWFLLAIMLMISLSISRTQGTTYINDITRQIENGTFEGVLYFVVLAVILQVFFYLFRWIVAIVCKKMDEKFAFELRVKLVEHLKKIPLETYESFSIGDLQSLIRNDTAKASVSIYIIFSRMISNFFIIIVTGLYMMTMDMIGSIIVIATSLLLGYINHLINKRVKTHEFEVRKSLGKVSQIVITCFELFDSIKLYKASEYILKKHSNERDRYIDATMGSVRLKAAGEIIVTLMHRIVLLGTCILLCYRAVSYQTLSIGEVLVFIALLDQVHIAISTIFVWMSTLMTSFASFDRIYDVLSVPEAKSRDEDNLVCQIQRVEFDHITYGYVDNENIINDRTLNLEMGKIYQISGESGSGKSTFLKLLLGLYFSESMMVQVDGQLMDYNCLQSLSSFVPSDPVQFNMSIFENLRLADINADKDKYRHAAMQLGIWDWIESFDDGLHHIIQNNSENLSGGQKQLLSILQAIVSNRPIIIMDEPFSALDESMETNLVKLLQNCNDKIVVFTSHRVVNGLNAVIYSING